MVNKKKKKEEVDQYESMQNYYYQRMDADCAV